MDISFHPMPLLSSSFTPGQALDYVLTIQDKDLQNIAMAEYHYFKGNPEQAAALSYEYLNSENISCRISAFFIHLYACLPLQHINQARYTISAAENTLDHLASQDHPYLQQLALNFKVVSRVLLHLPIEESEEIFHQDTSWFPSGLKSFWLYVYAHYTYLQGDYAKGIGIAETTLAMQSTLYPIPSTFLHLLLVMCYMSLRQPQKAKEHLLRAWEIAQPDDFIELFGEHHGLLGGTLEAVLKKKWPGDFKRMIAITYSFSEGWRKIHNPDTNDNVADNLTTMEFSIAMLAAKGWTNQEIGTHLCLSPNTIKQHISVALQKLNITHRKELKEYMLR